MNGMSPTMKVFGAPRRTHCAWWTITSMVAGMVSVYPSVFMESESPTRMKSIPAASANAAVGAS